MGLMPEITAILTTYRRPHTLRRQVEAIRAQTCPVKEVWLWANEPNRSIAGKIRRLALDRVVTCSVNAYVHSRFALALTATSEFVAIFDDDTIPGMEWLNLPPAEFLDYARRVPRMPFDGIPSDQIGRASCRERV